MFILEDKKPVNHNIIVEDRKKFTLTGVKDVVSFDEETVCLETFLGRLVIKG
ncbi:MAG: YabP/YqfC family sporulation protein, partial [Acutalibacteraceae bacterium]|nr:YabP/YqfC family sporulation protein [Acutalibacteraceae bacterium]